MAAAGRCRWVPLLLCVVAPLLPLPRCSCCCCMLPLLSVIGLRAHPPHPLAHPALPHTHPPQVAKMKRSAKVRKAYNALKKAATKK